MVFRIYSNSERTWLDLLASKISLSPDCAISLRKGLKRDLTENIVLTRLLRKFTDRHVVRGGSLGEAKSEEPHCLV